MAYALSPALFKCLAMDLAGAMGSQFLAKPAHNCLGYGNKFLSGLENRLLAAGNDLGQGGQGLHHNPAQQIRQAERSMIDVVMQPLRLLKPPLRS